MALNAESARHRWEQFRIEISSMSRLVEVIAQNPSPATKPSPSQLRSGDFNPLVFAGIVTLAVSGTAALIYYVSRISPRKMSHSSQSPREQYLSVIDQILDATPQNQLLPNKQVLDLLAPAHDFGYPELFERCLAERRQTVMGTTTDIDAKQNPRIQHQMQVLQNIEDLWQEGPNISPDITPPPLITEPLTKQPEVPSQSTTEEEAQAAPERQPDSIDRQEDAPQPQEQYSTLIQDLLARYLGGEFLSKEGLQQALATAWQQLENQMTVDSQQLEDCLAEQEQALNTQIQSAKDAVPAKIERSYRGVKMLQQAWEKLAIQTQNTAEITATTHQIATAQDTQQAFLALLEALDVNRTPIFSNPQIELLVAALKKRGQNSSLADAQDIKQFATGLEKGLAACGRLQSHITGWIFDGPVREAGFQQGKNPWEFWARKINPTPTQATNAFFQAEPSAQTAGPSSLPQAFFKLLGQRNLSVQEWTTQSSAYRLSDWVELVLVMRSLQLGLVTWFDQQAYNTKAGPKFSISVFLTFASLWSELAISTRQRSTENNLADGYFQITLQILRSFAQQPYFPLYGGVFASFSGGYLNMTLEYLDVPLKQVEGTHEKARILTLLGYSQHALGEYERALTFHQQALEIARTAGDKACEIANLNHLSRTYIAQKDYEQAIDGSQRALILSRESGERRGEANALANVGFSQVCAAQLVEQADPDQYVIPMRYLQQGLEIAQKLDDLQSQALCHSSLGIAHLTLSQPQEAISALEAGLEAANRSGDSYLKGLNFTNLAEAFHALDQPTSAVYYGGLGMYLLKQIESPDWSQAAGLLRVIKGQIGSDEFQDILQQQRTRMIQEIGVDGYDYIPDLLAQY